METDDSPAPTASRPIVPASTPLPETTNLHPLEIPKKEFEIPEGLSEHAKYIIRSQEREINRLDTAFQDLTRRTQDIIKERDQARHELAELKTETRISAIESSKPKGLNGLFPGGLEGLLGNPHLGPVIAQLASKFVNMIPEKVGTNSGEADAITTMSNWLSEQSEDSQRSFAEMIMTLTTVAPEKLNDTIIKVINLLKAGSTIAPQSVPAGGQQGNAKNNHVNASTYGAYTN